MKQKITTHNIVFQHLLNNKISVTIIESWMDSASIVLNCISSLCKEIPSIERIIIIASKRSIENEWLSQVHQEPWLSSLTYTFALGKEKRKINAFNSGRKIVFTNDESLSWTRELSISNNDMVVINDLSRYRHMESERYRDVQRICSNAGRIAAFSRLPFPQGIHEIWEEFFILDSGKRLGTAKIDFLERYFFVNRIWTNGHMKLYIEPKNNAEKAISRAVGDICIDLTEKSNDEKDKVRNVFVELSKSELSRYQLMAHTLSLTLKDGNKVSASDTSAVAGKLLQMASGTVYDDQRSVITFHNRKIYALKQLLEEMKFETKK